MIDDLRHIGKRDNEDCMALLEAALGIGAGLALVYFVAVIALESKANIKRANIRTLQLGCDTGVLSRSGNAGTYNWRTDQNA